MSDGNMHVERQLTWANSMCRGLQPIRKAVLARNAETELGYSGDVEPVG